MPATTTTTIPLDENGCTATEHYHASSGYCHADHEAPACHATRNVDYTVHDLNDPNQHVWMVVTPCGTNTPSPPNPLACPVGQHYHDVTDLCHQDHQVPVCDRANWLFYYVHDTADVNDHNMQLVTPCPNGPPTTTTTTTTIPPTTTTAPVLACGTIPQTEIDRVKDDFGWDSSFEGDATVWAGSVLPQGPNTGGRFVTSDKTTSSAAAEPPIWPVFPAASSVVDGQGCVWDSASVRSSWRELHLWSAADRTVIYTIAPALITQWNGLNADQQTLIRTSHTHPGASFPDCPLTTANPENDCDFWLAHPGVYAWQLQARFETNDGGVDETSWETLHSGASYLIRLIDYADYRITY